MMSMLVGIRSIHFETLCESWSRSVSSRVHDDDFDGKIAFKKNRSFDEKEKKKETTTTTRTGWNGSQTCTKVSYSSEDSFCRTSYSVRREAGPSLPFLVSSLRSTPFRGFTNSSFRGRALCVYESRSTLYKSRLNYSLNTRVSTKQNKRRERYLLKRRTGCFEALKFLILRHRSKTKRRGIAGMKYEGSGLLFSRRVSSGIKERDFLGWNHGTFLSSFLLTLLNPFCNPFNGIEQRDWCRIRGSDMDSGQQQRTEPLEWDWDHLISLTLCIHSSRDQGDRQQMMRESWNYP